MEVWAKAILEYCVNRDKKVWEWVVKEGGENGKIDMDVVGSIKSVS
jgi:hypothetical protein